MGIFKKLLKGSDDNEERYANDRHSANWDSGVQYAKGLKQNGYTQEEALAAMIEHYPNQSESALWKRVVAAYERKRTRDDDLY